MPTDAGFAGRLVDRAKAILATTLHIMHKPKEQQGFVLIPRRWPVQRTFAWLTAHRRLVRDYERDPAVSEAMIRWAAISTMARCIGRLADRVPGLATCQRGVLLPVNLPGGSAWSRR